MVFEVHRAKYKPNWLQVQEKMLKVLELYALQSQFSMDKIRL